MAAPSTADVERYTSGRLAKGDEETLRVLAAGLTAARRFCGWHVTGVQDDTVTLDGPGCALLTLPTLRLVALTGVTENGAEIDLTTLSWSPRGMIRKRSGANWSATLGGLVLTMQHGYDDAADFNAAVLSFADRQSYAADGGRPRTVGPFTYEPEQMAAGSAFTAVERALLEPYRLEAAA